MRFTLGGGSVLQIRTDQGLTGIGPGIDPALLQTIQKLLIGRDPFDTEQHAANLRYYASGASYRGRARAWMLRFGISLAKHAASRSTSSSAARKIVLRPTRA